jgi:hypothetical protein
MAGRMPSPNIIFATENGQYLRTAGYSLVGQWMKRLRGRSGPCQYKRDVNPDSVGERPRFVWTDFGAGKRAMVRLRSWTATSVRLMVPAHFLDFASSPRTDYVRFDLFRSLMGPHVSLVRAAETLLAPIACAADPSSRVELSVRTNRPLSGERCTASCQSLDVVDSLLRFGTALVVGIDIRGADDAPGVDHESPGHGQRPAALTVANREVIAKAEIDPLEIIG